MSTIVRVIRRDGFATPVDLDALDCWPISVMSPNIMPHSLDDGHETMRRIAETAAAEGGGRVTIRTAYKHPEFCFILEETRLQNPDRQAIALGLPPWSINEGVIRRAYEIPAEAFQGIMKLASTAEMIPTPGGNSSDLPRPPVQLGKPTDPPKIRGVEVQRLTPGKYNVISTLLKVWPKGLSKDGLADKSGHPDAVNMLKELSGQCPRWKEVIVLPGTEGRGEGYRIAMD